MREYMRIYDHYYGKFVKSMNRNKRKRSFSVSPSRQVQVIDTILSSLSYEHANALKLMIRWNDLTKASKVSSIPKSKIGKYYETATRHMYSPKNIELAVPGYFPKPRTEKDKETFTLLKAEDFGNCKYIVSALQKKSDIYYREQLMKHISAGWYYLWTIPGCGDAARMKILMAIDKWDGKEIKI